MVILFSTIVRFKWGIWLSESPTFVPSLHHIGFILTILMFFFCFIVALGFAWITLAKNEVSTKSTYDVKLLPYSMSGDSPSQSSRLTYSTWQAMTHILMSVQTSAQMFVHHDYQTGKRLWRESDWCESASKLKHKFTDDRATRGHLVCSGNYWSLESWQSVHVLNRS